MKIKASFIGLVPAAALILMAAVSPVNAGGPLANCESGVPYLWAGGGADIPWNPDLGDLGPLTNAQAVAEVQASFDVWEAVPTSSMSSLYAGHLPVDVTVANFGPWLFPVAPDGLSPVVFDDTGAIFDLLFGPGSGVLGFAGPEWGFEPDCAIIEGRAFLNGPSFVDATVARDVMVHEYGHYINLAHTVVNGQIFAIGDTSGPSPHDTFGLPPTFTVIETMYPFYFGPAVGTQTLEADEIAILSALYPEPGFFASTGTISGTIFAPDGTTRISGVNVIARNILDPFEDAVSAISGDFTDSSSQTDPVAGTYTLNGLTPGADYAVYVDQIGPGGFSTPRAILPSVEEFHNGVDESNNITTPDDPAVYSAVAAVAGVPATGVDVIFNAIGPGDPIPLGDDDFEEVFLPFTFSFCGEDYNSVYINSNGSLTFGSGDTDFTESGLEMLRDQPRIAMLWDDLAPNNGGTVVYDVTSNEFSVSYTDVPEFFSTGANSFEVTLQRSSNQITVNYTSLTATDGLAGISCGGRVTSQLEPESDLTALLSPEETVNSTSAAAIYEQFGAGENDLDGLTINYNAPKAFMDLGEPNDSITQATRVRLPYSGAGDFTEIEPTGADIDFYRIRAEGGVKLLAEVVTGNLDSLLGVFDADGNLLAADDDSGPGLLSRVVYPIPADGYYYVAVTAFPDFGFTGAGASGGRYVLEMSTILGFLLVLGDDDFAEVALPFAYPYQGGVWNSVYVNSNGNLTFGSGDTDFSESVAELLSDQPRIAALWDDLSPNQGGSIAVEETASTWTVSFVDVPEFLAGNSNNFSVTLDDTGGVDIAYGAVAATDGIVGLTEGGGAGDPGETDLSAAGALSATGTTYELFFGDFDLDGLTLIFLP